MSFKATKRLAVAALCLAAVALPAKADNLASNFTVAPQSWLGNVAQNIRLSPGGAFIVPFGNPLGGPVSVTFTAECQLVAGTTSWLHVSVLIDNLVTPPSGSDAAFCSGRGAGVQGGWARHSITVTRLLGPGAHNVRVVAAVSGVHTGARLDDTTIMVER